MTPLRFLLDECVSHDLIGALLSAEPAMDVIAVGQPGAPPKGTLDPDVLLAAETLGRTLISGDRSTMRRHLGDHFAAGHHTWGVILLRNGFPLARYVADIHLIWVCEGTADWLDRTDYIPY
jgi:hypothetical protein